MYLSVVIVSIIQYFAPVVCLPVNVITIPEGGTHVQVGPINVMVQPGRGIFRPFGLLVDVPKILHLRVANHPIGGTGVHVSVPIIDGLFTGVKPLAPLPPPIDDGDEDVDVTEGVTADAATEGETETPSDDAPVGNSGDEDTGGGGDDGGDGDQPPADDGGENGDSDTPADAGEIGGTNTGDGQTASNDNNNNGVGETNLSPLTTNGTDSSTITGEADGGVQEVGEDGGEVADDTSDPIGGSIQLTPDHQNDENNFNDNKNEHDNDNDNIDLTNNDNEELTTSDTNTTSGGGTKAGGGNCGGEDRACVREADAVRRRKHTKRKPSNCQWNHCSYENNYIVRKAKMISAEISRNKVTS